MSAAATIVGALAAAPPVAADGPDDWEVWLDAPVPRDAAPGSTVHLGFIMWDVPELSTVNVFGSEVHLHPASGNGAVKVGQVDEDWPGHSVTDLVVPRGGFGRLEFGVLWPRASTSNARSITLDFRRVPVAGIGSPPGMSLRRIGKVETQASVPAIAGQPFDVFLTFEPRVSWPPGSIALPDALTLRVRLPGVEDGGEVTATLVDPVAARYRASVLVDQPGPYVLEAAMGPDAKPDERFTDTEVRVVVQAADAASAAAASAAAPGVAANGGSVRTAGPGAADASPAPSGVPLLGLAVLGAVVVVLALAVGRFLRAEW